MRKSDKILLGLVGAGVVGVAGVAVIERSPGDAIPQTARLDPDSVNEWSAPADVPALSEDTDYPNDYYVPNVGYYHAPYHAFYPYHFNTFQSGRGYYHGGSWWPAAMVTGILSSRPSHSEVVRAAQVRSQSSPSRSSPFASRPSTNSTHASSDSTHASGSSAHGSTGSASGSKSGSSSSSGSVSHGGFGSTGHSSGSSSS